MKKQLLIAAVAATMSVAATADISIKGDALYRFANKDLGDGTGSNTGHSRVRLQVTGKSGDTTVKVGFRNDGSTRVGNGGKAGQIVVTNVATTTTATTTATAANDNQLMTDYAYLTTKIGNVNFKAGDWWATTGLGLVRKGVPINNGVVLGIKVGDWKIGVKATDTDNKDELFYTVKGKVAGFNVGVQISDNNADGYTDVWAKGKIGNINAAAEIWSGDVFDAHVIHLSTKVADITWHVATAEWGKSTTTGRFNKNSKFSPLGVSILGTASGVNGNLAVGNVNSEGGAIRTADTNVWGIRADAKVAGLGVQATVGNLDFGTAASEDRFYDVIVTKPLGKGSNLKISHGDWNSNSSTGIKVSVKF